MSRAGALGHAALAAVGTMLLLVLSEPVAWDEPRVDTDQWDLVAAVLGLAVVATGVIAGALDGTLRHSRSTAGLVLALVLDAVLLAPLLWVTGLVMLFLQLDDGGAPLDAVLASVGGWLAGMLLLHLVSAAVVRELDRRDG